MLERYIAQQYFLLLHDIEIHLVIYFKELCNWVKMLKPARTICGGKLSCMELIIFTCCTCAFLWLVPFDNWSFCMWIMLYVAAVQDSCRAPWYCIFKNQLWWKQANVQKLKYQSSSLFSLLSWSRGMHRIIFLFISKGTNEINHITLYFDLIPVWNLYWLAFILVLFILLWKLRCIFSFCIS